MAWEKENAGISVGWDGGENAGISVDIGMGRKYRDLCGYGDEEGMQESLWIWGWGKECRGLCGYGDGVRRHDKRTQCVPWVRRCWKRKQ